MTLIPGPELELRLYASKASVSRGLTMAEGRMHREAGSAQVAAGPAEPCRASGLKSSPSLLSPAACLMSMLLRLREGGAGISSCWLRLMGWHHVLATGMT